MRVYHANFELMVGATFIYLYMRVYHANIDLMVGNSDHYLSVYEGIPC